MSGMTDKLSLEITEERAIELGRCHRSYTYFISRYCKIYDSVDRSWIPFRLWSSQREVLNDIDSNQLTVILKARQLGISWLSLTYALWNMMFRPIATVSIFSRREEDSAYLMGPERLRGVYENLPGWMRTGYKPSTDRVHHWVLANKSSVRAFSTSSGDGYVSTLAVIDEADLSPDLNDLMRSVKPTIDTGGKMILLSRVNKDEPESEFKNIYRSAREGKNSWKPIFLPWYAHPGRSLEWYENQKRDIISRTGSLDELYEQYPETDDQALSSRVLDKRIPPMWLEAVYRELDPVSVSKAPALNGLNIYLPPVSGKRYVIGADPAEGNPNSDDSCATVVDVVTGEEQAVLVGKIEPTTFAHHIAQLSAYYNFAPAMVERNNHGHSVIQWLEEHARRVRLLLGHDADTHKRDKRSRERRKRLKYGWLSSTLGKTILYTTCANFIKEAANFDDPERGSTYVIHSRQTYSQLREIESDTLAAPKGQNDDRADSFALAIAGRKQVRDTGETGVLVLDKTRGWGL